LLSAHVKIPSGLELTATTGAWNGAGDWCEEVNKGSHEVQKKHQGHNQGGWAARGG